MSLALLVTHIVSFYVLIYYLPIRSYGRTIEVGNNNNNSLGRTYYNENVFLCIRMTYIMYLIYTNLKYK